MTQVPVFSRDRADRGRESAAARGATVIRFAGKHEAIVPSAAFPLLDGMPNNRCEWDESMKPAAPSPGPSPGPAPTPSPPAAPVPPTPCTMTSATRRAAPDGTANTRRKVGVGEVVEFTVGPAATWTASAGTAASVGAQATFVWTAPDTAASATVTATVPATGASCTATVDTILPSSLTMTRQTVQGFPAGTAGAGMTLELAFPPNDVSFGNAEMIEVAGPASGVSGYFAALQAAGTDLSHHPNPSFIRIGAANTVCCDTAAGSGFPPPWSAGGFSWVIPNRIRGAASTGAGTLFATTTQAFSIDAAGTVTVSKAGQSVTRSP